MLHSTYHRTHHLRCHHRKPLRYPQLVIAKLRQLRDWLSCKFGEKNACHRSSRQKVQKNQHIKTKASSEFSCTFFPHCCKHAVCKFPLCGLQSGSPFLHDLNSYCINMSQRNSPSSQALSPQQRLWHHPHMRHRNQSLAQSPEELQWCFSKVRLSWLSLMRKFRKLHAISTEFLMVLVLRHGSHSRSL